MIEPDMDYYKDPAAHVPLEVLPNALTHTLTDRPRCTSSAGSRDKPPGSPSSRFIPSA